MSEACSVGLPEALSHNPGSFTLSHMLANMEIPAGDTSSSPVTQDFADTEACFVLVEGKIVARLIIRDDCDVLARLCGGVWLR
ncbi:hypothetical protein G6N76_14070 [Rhizobium daejeonense]|uniref:Uncharacterized protein n=1 Tax=Rhizobium daejeonense TaxID=240521 RepID=A0A6M1RTN3_9HYPH|nr:hypothetical protein [Rhizobium daejeonense]NGO64792.1 hypothetical protein [Rhizobium daejeonense]